MPIFMDRHDVPGVTARDVARVHQEDLKIQDKYGCQVFTYWFDEDKGTAFCLIEAPDKKAVKEMHNEAHGLIPNRIIEVESNVVQAFLGRIKDPEPFGVSDESDLFVFADPAFRTIMVTALKDIPLIYSKPGVEEGLNVFRTHLEIIQKVLKQYDGRKVKHTDNGIIASFASVSKSVECAIEIQKRFKTYYSRYSGIKMQVAIGLSAGEPVSVSERDDFFGEVVQFARRLSYIADGGQLLISSDVKDLCKREGLGIPSEEGHNIKILNPDDETFLTRLMDVTEKIWNQEEFKVGDFGKNMGVSKSQLYRTITRLTGRSPSDFIKEFRLNKAIRLIERQKGNIAQIAFKTGFRNPSYFSKCFQQQFGILPSDYAKNLD